jgi:hypothetical protein
MDESVLTPYAESFSKTSETDGMGSVTGEEIRGTDPYLA